MMADATIDKVVYFVRHGQSEDNVAPVFQSPHSPLSEVGRTQAQRIAARVAKLAFDALLTSPYQRAKEMMWLYSSGHTETRNSHSRRGVFDESVDDENIFR